MFPAEALVDTEEQTNWCAQSHPIMRSKKTASDPILKVTD